MQKNKIKTPYSKMVLSSKRITLRPYKIPDLSLCIDTEKNNLVSQNKFDDVDPFYQTLNKDTFKDELNRHKRLAKEHRLYIFGAFSKKTGIYLGKVDLYIINPDIRWANLGCHISNQFWGQGYAPEAMSLALKLSFKDLGLHRIEAATQVKNYAARRAALKTGMIQEGKRKNLFGDKDYMVFGTNAIDFLKTK